MMHGQKNIKLQYMHSVISGINRPRAILKLFSKDRTFWKQKLYLNLQIQFVPHKEHSPSTWKGQPLNVVPNEPLFGVYRRHIQTGCLCGKYRVLCTLLSYRQENNRNCTPLRCWSGARTFHDGANSATPRKAFRHSLDSNRMQTPLYHRHFAHSPQ